MENCLFCNQEAIKEDILYETDNFFIKLNVGLINVGHIMIVTKKHYPCLAAIPNKLNEEYLQLKQFLIEKLNEIFAYPIIVEYGVWEQSVKHAHVHFIPLENKEINIAKELSKLEKIDFEEVNFNQLKKIYKKEKKYFYIEEKKRMYLFHVHELPQQKEDTFLEMRVFFPEILGIKSPRGWKNLSVAEKNLDKVRRAVTKELLKNL